METEAEISAPAVPEMSRKTVHYTPISIDKTGGVLDAEGYVPKEAIVDPGATKVFVSRTFATAINLRKDQLQQGDNSTHNL